MPRLLAWLRPFDGGVLQALMVLFNCVACQDVVEVVALPCEPGSAGVAVGDSAGVRVMDSVCPALAWGWVIGDSPLLEIGALDGDPASEFGGANLLGATRLSDGRIAILDGRAYELRYFAPTGRHVRTVGGPGDGPGEFGSLWPSVFPLPDDSVIVYEYSRYRLTVFDSAGDLAYTANIPRARPFPGLEYLGRTREGTDLVASSERPRITREAGVVPWTWSVWRLDDGGASADLVIEFPGELELVDPLVGSYTLPLSDMPYVGLWGGRVVVGDRATFAFRTYDLTGNPQMIVRREIQPQPVLARDLRDMHRAQAERLRRSYLDGEIARIDVVYRRPEIPRFHSTFDPVVPDRAGNLWVGVNEPTPGPNVLWRRTGRARIWSVFDSTGVWITDVRMPDGLRVTDIGEDYVLGVARTEYDVPVVRLYPLSK